MAYDTALLIGRFQPVHQGHIALLQHALQRAPRVVVVVGSAHQPRTPKNPFTWQERAALLRASVPAPDQGRLHFVPVRDYYDLARWTQAVRDGVHAITGTPPQAHRIALIGHFKDASSSYLSAFEGWDLVSLERQGLFDATPIRDAFFAADPAHIDSALARLHPALPPATEAFLQSFCATADAAALRHEWQVLRDYRAAWAKAPYPPVLVTVDAVLQCQKQVLLVQRGQAPGLGQWALPGGFVEPRDTLWQACLRELAEETQCTLPEAQWRAALQKIQVFDHPDRSQRGRAITHVHAFDLGDRELPPVQGGDDAALARWTPITQLASMEDQMFEDHFHILDSLLGLTD